MHDHSSLFVSLLRPYDGILTPHATWHRYDLLGKEAPCLDPSPRMNACYILIEHCCPHTTEALFRSTMGPDTVGFIIILLLQVLSTEIES
jgi:hypothetical protein